LKLSVTDIEKSYRSTAGGLTHVLRDVSFEAESGELVAITGASGAGKSTLLNIIGGLDSADRGAVTVDGFDITAASQRDLDEFHARRLGFVFQAHHLLPDFNAAENAAMPLLINRRSRGSSLEAARRCLAEVGLSESAEQRIGTLSGGEQQRVAIARALVNDPILILADEPTGNLDSSITAEVEEVLRNRCRHNEALVIVATHNTMLASRCDRHLVLAEGYLKEG
jgi:ABC-type lipoprotein export system ATPase subunit